MIRASVVIAVRDMDVFLDETLRSVAAQSMPDLQCIVVDDGSQDGTFDIAARWADADRRFVAVRSGGLGKSASRNLGLSHATAPCLMFLDGDDLLEAHALAAACATLDGASPEAPGAVGGVARIDAGGAPLATNDNRDGMPDGDHLRALLRKNFIVNGGALLIRRQAIERAGAFDETLRNGEDWELWCRLALLGDFVRVDGPPILRYRQHDRSSLAASSRRDLGKPTPAILRVAANAQIRARIGPGFDRMLRDRELDVFWMKTRIQMRGAKPAAALLLAARAVARRPRSLLHLSLALRFVRSLRRA